jgi:hypothetical protein
MYRETRKSSVGTQENLSQNYMPWLIAMACGVVKNDAEN